MGEGLKEAYTGLNKQNTIHKKIKCSMQTFQILNEQFSNFLITALSNFYQNCSNLISQTQECFRNKKYS